MEGCGFRDLKSDYDAKNAAILGVSFDSQAKNAKFHSKQEFNYPLLCDTDRSMGLAYGATTADSTKGASRIGYIIDPTGKVLHTEAKAKVSGWPEKALSLIP